jgi:hypothetical protein
MLCHTLSRLGGRQAWPSNALSIAAITEFQESAPTKGVMFNLGVSVGHISSVLLLRVIIWLPHLFACTWAQYQSSKAGDNQLAITYFDEALRLDPSLGVAYLTR